MTSCASPAPRASSARGAARPPTPPSATASPSPRSNPTEIDVLFERFVSPERKEPPDIDVDFEHERREEVIQYIYARYGRDRAGLAATVISYRARSAVRDVGKAMGLSEDTVAALAGMVWGTASGGELPEKHVRAAGLDPTDPLLATVWSWRTS